MTTAWPTPTQHRLSLSRGELCWFEWGVPRADRPTLLLVHATGFHARCWDGVVAALGEGWHIAAPDLRGHGRSYKPASLGNWAATGDDLLPLVDALGGGPIFAVGHSMGGVCSVRAAAQRPDRFSGLLLVDPVMFAPEFYAAPDGRFAGDPADHFVAKRRSHWPSAEDMRARFAERFPYSIWDPDVLAAYCRHGLLPRADGDGFDLACPPILEASAYMGSAAFDPLAAAAGLAMPITVIRARAPVAGAALDFSVSPTWPGLAAQLQRGSDEHWADCTHFIPMEAPARLAERIAAAARPR
jgi:pimeloyl-ACP methyl ester carboxylesterase